jgi:NADH-quinone oxidoreductase subunit H
MGQIMIILVWTSILEYIGYLVVISLLTIVPLLVSIAFFTLAERKIIASIQRRRGPNVVGFWGLLQPFADGLKAIIKEIIVPFQASKLIFIVSPCFTLFISLLNWTIIPFSSTEVFANVDYSLLYLYTFSSLSVFGIIFAGWSSKSKYPFLGAIRSTAQIISYEISIGFIFVLVTLCSHSINLIDIVYAQTLTTSFLFSIFPIAVIFFISIIAETNRAPFDLPEAEAEIVAGYNVEYSGIVFAFFFLGEYGNILIIATVYSLIFLGGWKLSPFFSFIPEEVALQIKAIAICFLFVLVRAAFPRYRYDQLIEACWKFFLPFTCIYLITVAGVFIYHIPIL